MKIFNNPIQSQHIHIPSFRHHQIPVSKISSLKIEFRLWTHAPVSIVALQDGHTSKSLEKGCQLLNLSRVASCLFALDDPWAERKHG